ncbi:hypothetical protein CI109_101547 [Kwoniella shandongensis]|uniref:DUF7719 domain-containing protein n=1 Tax=Kwoniella shandongensis TaxID=1734106 RepID=A0AAJ8MV17_9TREE
MAVLETVPQSGTTSSKPRSRRAGRNKTKEPSIAIPLVHPSTIRSTDAKPLLSIPNPTLHEAYDYDLESDLPEGIADFDALRQPGISLEEALDDQREDEIFNTLILTIPFSFLYILLDILVHLQYSHRPGWEVLTKHLMTAIPTNRHPNHFVTTSFLMAASIVSGCRLIWLVNKASWSLTTEQAPPMGTLWILTIVQLPLNRAVIALLAVGGWVWYSGMKIAP